MHPILVARQAEDPIPANIVGLGANVIHIPATSAGRVSGIEPFSSGPLGIPHHNAVVIPAIGTRLYRHLGDKVDRRLSGKRALFLSLLCLNSRQRSVIPATSMAPMAGIAPRWRETLAPLSHSLSSAAR
jgi:hypothetical protein